MACRRLCQRNCQNYPILRNELNQVNREIGRNRSAQRAQGIDFRKLSKRVDEQANDIRELRKEVDAQVNDIRELRKEMFILIV